MGDESGRHPPSALFVRDIWIRGRRADALWVQTHPGDMAGGDEWEPSRR
jgi:hypothetical protein